MSSYIEKLKQDIKYASQLNVEYQLSEVITTVKIYTVIMMIYMYFFFHFYDYLNDPVINIIIQLVIGVSFIIAAVLTVIKNYIIHLRIKNDLVLNKTRESQLIDKIIKYNPKYTITKFRS